MHTHALYSTSRAAQIAGVDPNHLWRAIHYGRTLPGPRIRHGKRDYYDEKGLAELLKAIKDRK